jgi:hypothetical protein
MDQEEALRARIGDIVERRNGIKFAEIEVVAKSLSMVFRVRISPAGSGHLFSVGSQRFVVSCSPGGDGFVMPSCIDDFADAMASLGWYED